MNIQEPKTWYISVCSIFPTLAEIFMYYLVETSLFSGFLLAPPYMNRHSSLTALQCR